MAVHPAPLRPTYPWDTSSSAPAERRPARPMRSIAPSNVTDPAFDPQANGMLVEDANGNYNFQATNAVEYIVNPGRTSSSISITNAPSAPGMKRLLKG